MVIKDKCSQGQRGLDCQNKCCKFSKQDVCSKPRINPTLFNEPYIYKKSLAFGRIVCFFRTLHNEYDLVFSKYTVVFHGAAAQTLH